jgi:hypothetical protein
MNEFETGQKVLVIEYAVPGRIVCYHKNTGWYYVRYFVDGRYTYEWYSPYELQDWKEYENEMGN